MKKQVESFSYLNVSKTPTKIVRSFYSDTIKEILENLYIQECVFRKNN